MQSSCAPSEKHPRSLPPSFPPPLAGEGREGADFKRSPGFRVLTFSVLSFKSTKDDGGANTSGLDNTFRRTADHRAAPVRECEILGRPHLDEARGRALELASLVAVSAQIKGGRLCRSGSKKLHAGIVKRVDQCNETLRLIVVGVGHDRHAIDNNRVELVSDSQIVNGAQRLLAKVVKAEASSPHGGARHTQQVSLHIKLDRMGLLTASEAPPRGIERLGR